MRKVILILLSFISLVLLLIRFGSEPLSKVLGLQPRAGIRVEANTEAKVYIDEKEIGKTPYQVEELLPGDHLVKVETNSSFWQGYVKLNSGTLSVVNRELAQTAASSSGEVITLEKGQGATIISTPDKADVEIDGKAYGKTPLFVSNLLPGEHIFLVSHNNFLKRSIRAMLAPGFNLNLNIDLAIAEADFTKISTIPLQSSKQVTVLQTPTNFLRVRSGASLNSPEVARVKPGDTLILLEELPSWDRVRLPDGKEGYVSSSFVEKKD